MAIFIITSTKNFWTQLEWKWYWIESVSNRAGQTLLLKKSLIFMSRCLCLCLSLPLPLCLCLCHSHLCYQKTKTKFWSAKQILYKKKMIIYAHTRTQILHQQHNNSKQWSSIQILQIDFISNIKKGILKFHSKTINSKQFICKSPCRTKQKASQVQMAQQYNTTKKNSTNLFPIYLFDWLHFIIFKIKIKFHSKMQFILLCHIILY